MLNEDALSVHQSEINLILKVVQTIKPEKLPTECIPDVTES